MRGWAPVEYRLACWLARHAAMEVDVLPRAALSAAVALPEPGLLGLGRDPDRGRRIVVQLQQFGCSVDRYDAERVSRCGLGRVVALLECLHRMFRSRYRCAGRQSLVLGLEALVGEEPAYGLDDRATVDDGAVDNAVGRDQLNAHGGDLESLPGGLELNRLYRTRTNVEPDQAFCSAKQHDYGVSRPEAAGQRQYQRAFGADSTISALNTGIGGSGHRSHGGVDYVFETS